MRVPVPSLRPPGRRGGVRLFGRPGLRPTWTAALTWSLLALALIAVAALVIGPATGRYRVNVVLSNSMQPQWEAGDLVVTRPIPPQELRVGQVITYHPPIAGRPSVTHRIVALREPGPTPIIRTKGDANQGPDDWGEVRLDGTRAWLVTRSVPNAGWAIAFVQQRTVRVVATVVAPLVLLVLILIGIWRPGRVARPV